MMIRQFLMKLGNKVSVTVTTTTNISTNRSMQRFTVRITTAQEGSIVVELNGYIENGVIRTLYYTYGYNCCTNPH